MRITKKFAGSSCIGKQVFSGGDGVIDDTKRKDIQEELKALEKSFMSKIDYQHKLNYPAPDPALAYVAAYHPISSGAQIQPFMGRYPLEPSGHLHSHQMVQRHPTHGVPGYPPLYYGVPHPPPNHHHRISSTTSESMSDSASEVNIRLLRSVDSPLPVPIPCGPYPFGPMHAAVRGDMREATHREVATCIENRGNSPHFVLRHPVSQDYPTNRQSRDQGHHTAILPSQGFGATSPQCRQLSQQSHNPQNQQNNHHQPHHSHQGTHHQSQVTSTSTGSNNHQNHSNHSHSQVQSSHSHSQSYSHGHSNLAPPYRPRQAHSSADLFGRQYPTTIEQMNFLSSENLRKKLAADNTMPSNGFHLNGRMGMGDAAKFCSAAAHAYSDKILVDDHIRGGGRAKSGNCNGGLNLSSSISAGSISANSSSSKESNSTNSNGKYEIKIEKEARQVDLEASDLLLNFFNAAGSSTIKNQKKEGSVSGSSGSGSTSNQGEQDGDDSVSNFSDNNVDGDASASGDGSGRSSSLSSDRSDNNSDIDYSSHDDAEVESEIKSDSDRPLLVPLPVPRDKEKEKVKEKEKLKIYPIVVKNEKMEHHRSNAVDEDSSLFNAAKIPRLI